MKSFTLLTVAAFAAFSVGAQTIAAAPLAAGDQLDSLMLEEGLAELVADRKKDKKKSASEAGALRVPSPFSYGPFGLDNRCRECAERCDENPDSARCRRCRARCE
jgi:hypothetical protein